MIDEKEKRSKTIFTTTVAFRGASRPRCQQNHRGFLGMVSAMREIRPILLRRKRDFPSSGKIFFFPHPLARPKGAFRRAFSRSADKNPSKSCRSPRKPVTAEGFAPKNTTTLKDTKFTSNDSRFVPVRLQE